MSSWVEMEREFFGDDFDGFNDCDEPPCKTRKNRGMSKKKLKPKVKKVKGVKPKQPEFDTSDIPF